MHTLIILKKNTQRWYLPLPPGRVTPTPTNVLAQPESQGAFRKLCTGAKDTGRGGFRHHLPRQSGRAPFPGEGLTCAGLTPVEQSSDTHATQEAAVRSKALPESTAQCMSRARIRFIEGQLPLTRRETETQKRNVASLVRRIQGLAKLVSRRLLGPPKNVSQLTDQKTPAAPNPRISKRRDNAQPRARSGANGPPARPRRRAITPPDGTDNP